MLSNGGFCVGSTIERALYSRFGYFRLGVNSTFHWRGTFSTRRRIVTWICGNKWFSRLRRIPYHISISSDLRGQAWIEKCLRNGLYRTTKSISNANKLQMLNETYDIALCIYLKRPHIHRRRGVSRDCKSWAIRKWLVHRQFDDLTPKFKIYVNPQTACFKIHHNMSANVRLMLRMYSYSWKVRSGSGSCRRKDFKVTAAKCASSNTTCATSQTYGECMILKISF